tara:strand:+ start:236 stop:412 length:177 start_codon:yes stop_codon:yes gene_type:complete
VYNGLRAFFLKGQRMNITITYADGNYELVIDGLEVWVGTKAGCEAKAIELKSFIENKG